MKIKVSEATAEALDWMVAKCEGTPSVRMFENSKGFRVYKNESMKMQGINFAPSTAWTQGGPIIDREGIGIFCNLTQTEASRFVEAHPDWRAFSYRKHHEHHFGRTALIAAMRCYVASKLGDEVEVPKELTCQPTPSA